MQLVKLNDDVLSVIQRGEKLPNGLYKSMSKEQRLAVRNARLEAGKQLTDRMLSAEMVTNGFVIEKCEKSTNKAGDVKVSLSVYKRTQKAPVVAKADVTQLSEDELMAEIERRKQAQN